MINILTLFLSCIPLLCVPAVQADSENTVCENGFTVKVRGMDVKVEFYSPSIVRVLKYDANSDFSKKKNFVVVLEPETTEIIVSDKDNMITAESSELQVRMDKETGRIVFLNKKGDSI